MSEFLAMGGYAFYVWTAYGFFAVVMVWIAVAPLLRRRTMLRELEDRLAREDARAARRSAPQATARTPRPGSAPAPTPGGASRQ